jgi:hypothetical protein
MAWLLLVLIDGKANLSDLEAVAHHSRINVSAVQNATKLEKVDEQCMV